MKVTVQITVNFKFSIFTFIFLLHNHVNKVLVLDPNPLERIRVLKFHSVEH